MLFTFAFGRRPILEGLSLFTLSEKQKTTTTTSTTQERTYNHWLEVKTGGLSKIPINLRVCSLCQNQVKDEFHFSFQCKIVELIIVNL